MAILEAATGHHPTWAVQFDVSGRIDGTAAVHQMIARLLQLGGVATDDSPVTVSIGSAMGPPAFGFGTTSPSCCS